MVVDIEQYSSPARRTAMQAHLSCWDTEMKNHEGEGAAGAYGSAANAALTSPKSVIGG